MTEQICTNGHVVDTGANHCQRCNAQIISDNQIPMEEETKQPSEETSTDESSAEESTDSANESESSPESEQGTPTTE